MQTNPAVEQNKTLIDGPRVHGISPVGKQKVYGGKDLLKSQVLSLEWNTERVREDASCDSEDGEDDELPCVIRESEGIFIFERVGLILFWLTEAMWHFSCIVYEVNDCCCCHVVCLQTTLCGINLSFADNKLLLQVTEFE